MRGLVLLLLVLLLGSLACAAHATLWAVDTSAFGAAEEAALCAATGGTRGRQCAHVLGDGRVVVRAPRTPPALPFVVDVRPMNATERVLAEDRALIEESEAALDLEVLFFWGVHTVPVLPHVRARTRLGDEGVLLLEGVGRAERAAVVDQLLALDTVLLVQVARRPEVLNYDALQALDVGPEAADARLHTFLDGTGERVAVTDTGAAWTNVLLGGAAPTVVGHPQMKVADEPGVKIPVYWDFMDQADAYHGTHVAGSATGRVVAGLQEFAGAAPKASLVVVDMGCQTPGGCECTHELGPTAGAEMCPCSGQPGGKCPQSETAIYAPVGLRKHLLEWVRVQDAKVVVNSWGTTVNAYRVETAQIDTFVWNRRDVLPVFAAGNAGAAGSVSSQSNSKNGLAVGASLSTAQGIARALQHVRGGWTSVVDAVADSLYEMLGCAQDPDDSECVLLESLTEAQCCDDTESGKCGLVLYRMGGADAGPMCCRACIVESLEERTPTEELAPFSSRGPASGGRLKPDVVAPGRRITSAANPAEHGGDTDAVTSLQGTSMSAPLAAGMVVRLRQFLRTVYTVGGAAVVPAPTAALLKATLIAGTQPLKYGPWSASTQTHAALGTYDRGFGLPVLQNVLGNNTTPGRTASGLHSFVVLANEDRALNTTAQLWQTQVTPGAAGALRVVLCYTDYPAVPGTTGHVLVNDLDLEVVHEGTTYLGNAHVLPASEVPDRANNVESVAVPSGGSSVTVRVRAHAVPKPPQPFAVVLVHDGGIVDPPAVGVHAIQPPMSMGPLKSEASPVHTAVSMLVLAAVHIGIVLLTW